MRQNMLYAATIVLILLLGAVIATMNDRKEIVDNPIHNICIDVDMASKQYYLHEEGKDTFHFVKQGDIPALDTLIWRVIQ